MKHSFLLGLLCLFLSCKNEVKEEIPNTDFKAVSSDFLEWWTYHNNNIVLSSEFIPVDENDNMMDKEPFLKALTTGNYIPLKLKTPEVKYKLFKLENPINKDIKSTIKKVSTTAYLQFKKEGTPFPDFSFIDINGNFYDNNALKGKIVFIKCWFINCKPCIAEFPKLNELVSKYKDRKDVVFISLALDNEESLKAFFENNDFNYVTIPNQNDFITDKLNVYSFPTHFLIDRNGRIKKETNTIDELLLALNTSDILNTTENIDEKMPPPPPPPPVSK